MKIQVKTPLETVRLGNKLWVLTEDFEIKVADQVIVVPKGFVTDGASAPRFLWWICSPVAGPFGEAAVVHDFLYSMYSKSTSRAFADDVLYWVGVYRGASVCRAWLVKKGVNWFGAKHYKVIHSKITMKACYNHFEAWSKIKELRREQWTKMF